MTETVRERYNYYTVTKLEKYNKKYKFTRDMEIKKNTSLAAKGALANRLQRRTACKIQNGRQGAPKCRTRSGKVSIPSFWGVLSNFR